MIGNSGKMLNFHELIFKKGALAIFIIVLREMYLFECLSFLFHLNGQYSLQSHTCF